MSTIAGRAAITGAPGTYWWMVALRGVVAVLFGLAIFARPGLSVAVLVLLFGAFVLAGGMLAIVAAIRASERHESWSLLFLDGLLGIVVGLLTFFWPGITALALLVVIASWAIVTGLFQIGAAFGAYGGAGRRWWMGISGVLSIVLGILLFSSPAAGILAVVWVIGIYGIAFGVAQIVLGFEMRRYERMATA